MLLILKRFLNHFAALARPPVRRVLLKQIYFTANEAVWLVAITGFALGATVVVQLHEEYGQSRDAALRLLGSLSFVELSPLLACLMMVARSASAMAIELASMRISGEVAALRRMGISIESYLLLPRVLGMTLAAVVLAGVMSLASVLGGVLFATGWDASYQIFALERMLRWHEVLICLLKAASFGLVAGVVSIYAGFSVPLQVSEIPKAASRAVLRGLLALFVLDFCWALVL
ncbi:ABC transporter permease [Deefgea sp. CFH1-16]|nr:ABC transporter permease [Deefgea sp. CFH1-16]